MTADTAPAPVCPSWCEVTLAEHADSHETEGTYYSHHCHEFVLTIPEDRSYSASPGPQRVQIDVTWCQDEEAATQEGGPSLFLPDMALTLDEARTLAAKLIEFTEQVEHSIQLTGWPVQTDR